MLNLYHESLILRKRMSQHLCVSFPRYGCSTNLRSFQLKSSRYLYAFYIPITKCLELVVCQYDIHIIHYFQYNIYIYIATISTILIQSTIFLIFSLSLLEHHSCNELYALVPYEIISSSILSIEHILELL